MRGNRGLKINPTVVLASCGLGLNLVWCTLMGHTVGFMPSASGMESWVNPRLFFLGGIFLCTMMFIVMPHSLKRADVSLRFILPLMSAVGTACFGVSYCQTLFDSNLLAMGGLFVAGMGYFWLAARYILLLARTCGYWYVVASVAGSLVVKLPILLALSTFASPAMQVVVAIVIPVITAFLFEGACAFAHGRVNCSTNPSTLTRGINGALKNNNLRTVFDIPIALCTSKNTSGVERNTMLVLLVVVAIVLAVIRSVSYLGVWGDVNANISITYPWLTAIVIPSVCVVAFSYVVLMRPANASLSIRFQPALLFILAGLFVVSVHTISTGVQLRFLTVIIQIDELFAHLLFWAVVATALNALNMPSYRVIGFAGIVYAGGSIAWVLLFAHMSIADVLLAMLMVYVFVIGLLCAIQFVPNRKDNVFEKDTDPEKDTVSLAQTVSDTCFELAKRYALSSRETEVFCLLAQGRTHTFIQNELALSGGTVKTHISHIYTKMGVRDRQEMMNLIWNE